MKRVVISLAVALTLVACGSTDSDVSPAAKEALAGPVAELRYTATAGDLAAAQARVAAVRAKVDELEGSGDLTKEAATRIRRAVDDVERRLPSIAPGSPTSASTASSPASSTSAAPPTTPSPTEPTGGGGGGGKDDGKGKDKKGGKGG